LLTLADVEQGVKSAFETLKLQPKKPSTFSQLAAKIKLRYGGWLQLVSF
jgi:hypothetical protein